MQQPPPYGNEGSDRRQKVSSAHIHHRLRPSTNPNMFTSPEVNVDDQSQGSAVLHHTTATSSASAYHGMARRGMPPTSGGSVGGGNVGGGGGASPSVAGAGGAGSAILNASSSNASHLSVASTGSIGSAHLHHHHHGPMRMHQPHGVAAIGPSSSNLSNSTSLPNSVGNNSLVVSMESPLPAMVQRSLGDRSTEKRKNAALEIEALIKSLQEANNMAMIQSVITVLSKDFCTSMNSNYRKGGLVGLAATAIGLMGNARTFLNVLLPPVLHCFDDPESRVRYYACESLYNISKVSRQAVLERYFAQIWEGLTKLYADVDVDVKNGANLLDRLIKDIVTEADNFRVDHFLPLLQTYIRRTNPYIRQLIVGWIAFLDSIPDISMLDYLPEFLDGLFNMLSDTNREIRQAADAALAEFLRELSVSAVVELGPVTAILVQQCQSPERLNRLTAIAWLVELLHHPTAGGPALLPTAPPILAAVLSCISDDEAEIRVVAERTNDVMLKMVRAHPKVSLALAQLLETLTQELLSKEDVPTKMACLRWINMLMEQRRHEMNVYTESLLPVLLRTLSDPSDAVVLLDLQALSRISLAQRNEPSSTPAATTATSEGASSSASKSKDNSIEEVQFQLVLNAILNLFAQDRQLLETRGSLIVRKLCVLLNAKSVYIRMADTLASYGGESDDKRTPALTLSFVSTMVQTLNLILLTASELHELRTILASSFQDDSSDLEGSKVFITLFHCWCHNPVSTFSLCLLARVYDLSFALVKRFAEMRDVSVSFLMQIDKLVQLLESPVFLHLRLQLLDVEAPHHAALLKSIYGLLMCLPQGDAFRLLNDRLTTVCNLRDNLGMTPAMAEDESKLSTVSKTGLSLERLLERFDDVCHQHEAAKHSRLEIESEPMIIPLLGKLPGPGFTSAASKTMNSSLAAYSGPRVRVNVTTKSPARGALPGPQPSPSTVTPKPGLSAKLVKVPSTARHQTAPKRQPHGGNFTPRTGQ